MKIIPIVAFALYSNICMGQLPQRPLEQLINTTDPGWPIVKRWIDSAKNKVEILPVDSIKARDALFKSQVTTRSLMGAIIYGTGGLLIDNGWIRILGSGCAKLNRTLPDWNKGKSFKKFGEGAPFLLIADDATGGFFMLNGGSVGNDLGKVYYFAPDNLEYESMRLTYSEFLNFCFNNNLDEYYEGYRWKNWKNDLTLLDGDKVFNFFPPLWSKEGKDIEKSSRKAVPIEEQYSLNLNMRKQIGLDK